MTKLLINYRSLPSILSFFNQQFYKFELIPDLSDTDSREAKILRVICNGRILPANPANHGIYFRDVCGNQRRINGTSPCNRAEAKEVFASNIQSSHLNRADF